MRNAMISSMLLALATAACKGDDPSGDGGTAADDCGIGDARCLPIDAGDLDATAGMKLDLGDDTGLPTGDANAEGFTSGCGEVTVVVTPVTPTLVLLVDQSGSMTDDFGNMNRWEALYETLMDPVDGVVINLEESIRFGLTLYTSENGNAGGRCPMLTTVPPDLNNHAAIDAVFGPAQPVDETPTGESLAVVAQELAAFAERGPKGIVLATDGMPDTCQVPNPQEGEPEAIAAAQMAFGLGIETFVLSVGPDVAQDHLQEMANVGVGKDPNDPMPAPYWQALDPQQLVDAFNEIIGSFVSCTLPIDGVVDLDKACDGTVKLDGVELSCGVDWQLPDESTLELLGDACDTLRDGKMHDVDASWPCDAVQIP